MPLPTDARPKLFVAISLPATTSAALVAIQPRPSPRIRLVEQSQLHLTLHYLGGADQHRTAARLSTISSRAFDITITGVGQFVSPDGTVTLWAGVDRTTELIDLHVTIAAALATEGFRPEPRPYTPHITLARCEPAEAGHADAFRAQHEALFLGDVPVVDFAMYASELIAGAPRYRRVTTIALHR